VVLVLIITKQRWRSLCITAAIITILCLPLDFNLLEKAFKIGLLFLATTAGKYRALRNLEEPSLDNLALPLTEELDVLCLGTRPA
jgi:hypothetical protein